jgi:hypothetical protein
VSSSEDEAIAKRRSNRAGHYEILGETYAKFEFFEQGWNPYSRFLDVDKVDFLLRRVIDGRKVYREVQVKYGKLYEVELAWARRLFDVTSWRFFKPDEFADQASQDDFFVAYVLARDIGYQRDIFIFPVRTFSEILAASPTSGERVKVYLSHCKGDGEKWVLRKTARRFDEINDDTCLDVSNYRRNFDLLRPQVAR